MVIQKLFSKNYLYKLTILVAFLFRVSLVNSLVNYMTKVKCHFRTSIKNEQKQTFNYTLYIRCSNDNRYCSIPSKLNPIKANIKGGGPSKRE